MNVSKLVVALFAASLLAVAIPPVSAAIGSQCNQFDFSLGNNNKIMTTKVCSPSEAAVGSEFYVNAFASITTGSLVISLDDAADWDFNGCSLVSSSDLDGTLTESTMALVSMDSPTCSIHFYASEGLLVDSAVIPLVISVFDPTATLPTDFNQNLTGQLDLDILSIPDLNVYLKEWPELFASIDIDNWPTLVTALSGSLDVTVDGALNTINTGTIDVTGVTIDAIVNQDFANASVESFPVETANDYFILIFFLVFVVLAILGQDLFMMIVAVLMSVYLIVTGEVQTVIPRQYLILVPALLLVMGARVIEKTKNQYSRQ